MLTSTAWGKDTANILCPVPGHKGEGAEILEANTFFCTPFYFSSLIPSAILVHLDFDVFLPLPLSIYLFINFDRPITQFSALSSIVQVSLTFKTITFPFILSDNSNLFFQKSPTPWPSLLCPRKIFTPSGSLIPFPYYLALINYCLETLVPGYFHSVDLLLIYMLLHDQKGASENRTFPWCH